MSQISNMLITLLHKNIGIIQVGYFIAAAFELGAIFLVRGIVLALPKLRSFAEIEMVSFFGLFFAISGAITAIITLHSNSKNQGRKADWH